MTTQTLTNRAEMRDALAERGGRNLPVAAGGASSGTARKGHSCTGTENLMEAVVERENMLNALRRVVSNKGAAGVDAIVQDVLFDPQTSGGLLIAVHPDDAEALLEALLAAGCDHAAEIGRVAAAPAERIIVT